MNDKWRELFWCQSSSFHVANHIQRMIFRMLLNNDFGETLPQRFSDPAMLFLREESWLVRERETRHVAVPEQPSAAPRQHPSAFRVRRFKSTFKFVLQS